MICILFGRIEILGEIKRWCTDKVRRDLNIDVLLKGFLEEAKEEGLNFIILLLLSLRAAESLYPADGNVESSSGSDTDLTNEVD